MKRLSRFPRNSMVYRLEVLADAMREWSYEYSRQLSSEHSFRYSARHLGQAAERQQVLKKLADQLEAAAVDVYGLW